MTDHTDTQTRAVTVADAYDGKLLQTGVLKSGYKFVDIEETDDGIFALTTEGGNTLYKYADDWLDYTPRPTPAAPEGQRSTIAARVCPDARDAEIVRLEQELATALETMHTLQDARNHFAQRLQQIARHCQSLPDNAGEIDSTNAGYIIETVNYIYELTQWDGGE